MYKLTETDELKIAQIAHQANKALCETLGDDSQPEWSHAPLWQQASAIDGVRFHWNKLSAGEVPSPSASHDNWLKQKRSEGWVYGTEKNPTLKQHPCMVEYHELPLAQRTKDYLFAHVVKAFFAAFNSENN
jgi:hypothetical protein